MLNEGEKLPTFSMKSAEERQYSNKDFLGKKIVLYFYPKDDTSGCTCEAKEFTDRLKEFEKKGSAVAGVSPDSPESHAKFIQKHGLKLLLLSDQGSEFSKKCGVWVEKSLYGRKYMGVERTTVVVGANGVIEKVFRKVKAEGHAGEVLVCVSE